MANTPSDRLQAEKDLQYARDRAGRYRAKGEDPGSLADREKSAEKRYREMGGDPSRVHSRY